MHIDSWTDRQTDRQTDTDRQRHRQTDRQTDRDTDRALPLVGLSNIGSYHLSPGEASQAAQSPTHVTQPPIPPQPAVRTTETEVRRWAARAAAT